MHLHFEDIGFTSAARHFQPTLLPGERALLHLTVTGHGWAATSQSCGESLGEGWLMEVDSGDDILYWRLRLWYMILKKNSSSSQVYGLKKHVETFNMFGWYTVYLQEMLLFYHSNRYWPKGIRYQHLVCLTSWDVERWLFVSQCNSLSSPFLFCSTSPGGNEFLKAKVIKLHFSRLAKAGWFHALFSIEKYRNTWDPFFSMAKELRQKIRQRILN